MPNPDDILKAMRAAGDEFARMADTVEEKLPAIAKSLSRAPRQLQPLIRSLDEIAKKAEGIKLDRLVTELAEADKGAGRFLQTIGKVDKQLQAAARTVATLVSSHRDLSIEAQKSIQAVSSVAEKVNSTIAKSLSKRTSEFKDLNREAEKAIKNFQPPADGGGSGPAKGRPGAHLSDNKDHKERVDLILAQERASRRLKDEFASMEGELSPIKEHFYGIEEGLKGLSGLIIKSKADLSNLSPEGMLEWGKSAVDQIDQLIASSEKFPGLEPMSVSQLKNIRAAAVGMNDMTENADGMRGVMEGVGKQLEEVKSQGRGLNKALLKDIQRLADETGSWYGVSKKNQSELVTWRVKHQKAAERMVERGIRPSWAYAVQLGKAVKSVPIKALADEGKELMGALKGALAQITGIKSLSITGIAKGFLETEDSIIKARQELIEMASASGELSAMWSAGLGAGEIEGEFDKLRDSMNNMLNTWGVTRKDAQASTKALLDAGFSMSSIVGPTLKEGTDSMLGFAKGGEHAMTALDDLGKLTRLTGRSMADISSLAGQWREQLGTTIGQVGDQYLELQGHARRSGMAVGKFMDRVMASASGFVIFGGQIKSVSDTLSTLMSGMQLPPGLAQQVAGDFMDKLRDTTMEEAMMTVGLLGSEGRDAALKSYKSWVDNRGEMLGRVEREIAALESKRASKEIDEKTYSELRGAAENRRKALETEQAKLTSLVAKAEQGDKASLAGLAQAAGRQADMSAVFSKLTADAVATGGIMGDRVREAIAAGKEPAEIMEIMADGFNEQASSGKGLVLLQGRLKDMGYKNEKEFQAVLDGAIGQHRMLKKYGEIVGRAGDHIVQLVKDGGSLEEVTAAIEESVRTPAQLLDNVRKLQAAGFAVPDQVQKKLEEAKKKFIEFEGIDSEKQAEATHAASQAMSAYLKKVIEKPSPPEIDIKEHAKKQTSLQEKINEHLLDIKNKYWKVAIVALGAIALAMKVRALGDLLPGKGMFKKVFKKGGKLLKRFTKGGRVGKLLRGARAATRGGKLAKVGKLASKAKTLASGAAKRGAGMAGKALGAAGKIASKAAVPLVVAAEIIGAGMEVKGIRDAAAASAKERSKALGDSEKEIAEKEARARKRATTKGVVGKAVGQAGGGIGGALSGAAMGAAIGSIIPGIGTAIGGLVGGILGAMGGGWIGKKAGKAIGEGLETEASRWAMKLEELSDLGSVDDVKAAIEEENKRRSSLQAEKMALIEKEINGELLTHGERARLQEIQRDLIDMSRLANLKQIEAMKENEVLQESIEEKMATTAKFKLDAIKKQRALKKKKKTEGLTTDEENELATATEVSKMSHEDIAKYQVSQKKRKERTRLKREQKALSGLTVKTDRDKERLQEIEGIFSSDAEPVAPDALKPPNAADGLDTVEKLSKKAAAVGGKTVVDKSTWNVSINSHSAKELEQTMLKMKVKQEQHQAN